MQRTNLFGRRCFSKNKVKILCSNGSYSAFSTNPWLFRWMLFLKTRRERSAPNARDSVGKLDAHVFHGLEGAFDLGLEEDLEGQVIGGAPDFGEAVELFSFAGANDDGELLVIWVLHPHQQRALTNGDGHFDICGGGVVAKILIFDFVAIIEASDATDRHVAIYQWLPEAGGGAIDVNIGGGGGGLAACSEAGCEEEKDE